jgi:cytochrome c6
MKKVLGGAIVGIGVCLFVMKGIAAGPVNQEVGKAEFNEHCLVCHPNGGNVLNPSKTLHTKDMEANNVKTPEDIVKIMRNPGPGMTKFNEDTIPDKVAKEIAEYIIKAFK